MLNIYDGLQTTFYFPIYARLDVRTLINLNENPIQESWNFPQSICYLPDYH